MRSKEEINSQMIFTLKTQALRAVEQLMYKSTMLDNFTYQYIRHKLNNGTDSDFPGVLFGKE